jgi:hypothetical protein
MFAIDMGLDAPFRYHEIGDSLAKNISPDSSLYEMLNSLKGLKASAVDTVPRRHEAMGLPSYCKSTSPLRRAFDLILHHQIRGILKAKRSDSIPNLQAVIPKMYHHEQFLKRLCAHEVLLNSSQFIIFCTAEDEEFVKTKKNIENKASTTFYGVLKTWMSDNPLANNTPNKIAVIPPRLSVNFSTSSTPEDPGALVETDFDDAGVTFTVFNNQSMQLQYVDFLRVYGRCVTKVNINLRRLGDFRMLLQKFCDVEEDPNDSLVLGMKQVVYIYFSNFVALRFSVSDDFVTARYI